MIVEEEYGYIAVEDQNATSAELRITLYLRVGNVCCRIITATNMTVANELHPWIAIARSNQLQLN